MRQHVVDYHYQSPFRKKVRHGCLMVVGGTLRNCFQKVGGTANLNELDPGLLIKAPLSAALNVRKTGGGLIHTFAYYVERHSAESV